MKRLSRDRLVGEWLLRRTSLAHMRLIQPLLLCMCLMHVMRMLFPRLLLLHMPMMRVLLLLLMLVLRTLSLSMLPLHLLVVRMLLLRALLLRMLALPPRELLLMHVLRMGWRRLMDVRRVGWRLQVHRVQRSSMPPLSVALRGPRAAATPGPPAAASAAAARSTRHLPRVRRGGRRDSGQRVARVEAGDVRVGVVEAGVVAGLALAGEGGQAVQRGVERRGRVVVHARRRAAAGRREDEHGDFRVAEHRQLERLLQQPGLALLEGDLAVALVRDARDANLLAPHGASHARRGGVCPGAAAAVW